MDAEAHANSLDTLLDASNETLQHLCNMSRLFLQNTHIIYVDSSNNTAKPLTFVTFSDFREANKM